MICNSCGKENPDGAVYCMSCGKRLDGKKVCLKCGSTIDEEARFCPYCGTHLFAPVAEPEKAHAETAEQVESVDLAETAETPASHGRVFRILGICGGASAMVALLFSLIFVFFIGLKITADGVAMDGGSIYDVFYRTYDQIGQTLAQFDKDTGPISIALYVPAILCTIAAIGGFILVPTFTAVSVVKFTRQMMDGKKRNYFSYAVGAYVGFLVTALILFAFSTTGASGTSATGSGLATSELVYSFNGATVAGIVLGGVFLGISAGLQAASRGGEFANVRTIVGGAISLIVIVLTSITFAFARLAQVEATVAEGTQSVSIRLSPIAASTLLGLRYILDQTVPSPDGELILAVGTALATVAILVLTGVLFANAAARSTKEKAGHGIVLSSAIFGCALLSLIFHIVFMSMFDSYMFGTETSPMQYSYAAPIAVLVMSALMLAASIVSKVLDRNLSK